MVAPPGHNDINDHIEDQRSKIEACVAVYTNASKSVIVLGTRGVTRLNSNFVPPQTPASPIPTSRLPQIQYMCH